MRSLTVLALGLATAGCVRERPRTEEAPHGEAVHWDYGGERGPAAWGTLDPKYALCESGKAQSPIDLTGAPVAKTLPPLSSTYRAAALRMVRHEAKADIVNTGHSIQVNSPDTDTLYVGTDDYRLVQYHFHSPSEHQVDGVSFPMEMHLVHRSADGRLAVGGVLIREGAHNDTFERLLARMPGLTGTEMVHDSVEVNVEDLLPVPRTTWRYDGSLTTPPCSEGVKWFVLTTPIEVSPAQVAAFRAVLSGNSRPVQSLNGRTLVTDAAEAPK